MVKFENNSVGILGGSFDPPHKGHLKISLISIKKFNLNKLIWMITKKNPFKKKPFFSLNQRISKCQKLTKKYKKIKIQYLDEKIKSTRTINTIKYIKKKNKKKIIYLIIGSDNLVHFHRWVSSKKLLKLCVLIVFSRKGFDKKAKKSVINKSLKNNNIIFVKNKKIDISSTNLRKIYLNKTK